mmetsp:Transcript_8697/g.15037  ORF Transcript_8697/g.15037 Transcript_8697/m.15037 type:complete len:204 (-) Transcript_8697:468-1079(-)
MFFAEWWLCAWAASRAQTSCWPQLSGVCDPSQEPPSSSSGVMPPVGCWRVQGRAVTGWPRYPTGQADLHTAVSAVRVGMEGAHPQVSAQRPAGTSRPVSSFGSALVRWRSSRDNPASASSPALHVMTPSTGDASPLVSAGGLSPDRRGVARMSGRVCGDGANSGASQNGFAQLLGAALAPFRSGGERVFTQSTSATDTSVVAC